MNITVSGCSFMIIPFTLLNTPAWNRTKSPFGLPYKSNCREPPAQERSLIVHYRPITVKTFRNFVVTLVRLVFH